MKTINMKTVIDSQKMEWKGSQQRCLLLTSMGATELQESLIHIIGQETIDKLKIKFTDDFDYFPKGLANPREIELDKEKIPIDGSIDYCTKLNKWWLKKSAKTPVWDLVCKAEIEGLPGLILVEAKAHNNELYKEKDKTGSEKGSANYNRIEEALKLVNTRYKYNLSPDTHYQLSNRIAWSIKLASLGIPVVLIYLGCINTEEMLSSINKNDPLIKGSKDWKELVENYSGEVGFKQWEEKILGKWLQEDESCSAKPSFLYPIIRAVDIQLVRGEINLNYTINSTTS